MDDSSEESTERARLRGLGVRDGTWACAESVVGESQPILLRSNLPSHWKGQEGISPSD